MRDLISVQFRNVNFDNNNVNSAIYSKNIRESFKYDFRCCCLKLHQNHDSALKIN